MFFIGEFSQMGKTTVKTLHYYDRIGLLCPESVDPVTGYRIYTTRQLLELHRIQSLRQAGLTVDEISKVIINGADLQAILEKRKAELTKELQDRQDQLTRIAYMKSHLTEEQHMNYQTTIKDIPAQIVYTKRLTVPNYAAYYEVIPAIGRAIAEANPNLECAKPEYCYVSYLDGEYKETDINIEYNEAVTQKGNDVDGIFFREINPVTVAAVMHKGSYANLPQAYAYIMDWVEKNGYKIAEAPRECYIDGIWNETDEQDWLTEIQVPIVK